MEFTLADGDPESFHRLVSSIVVPRPIGWMSSQDEAGRVNLAPFSYFTVASTAPPVLVFSCEERDDGSRKDTPSNVIDTGEFVYNLVTEDVIEQVDRSSAPLAPDENEFEVTDLTEAPSATVSPPRVAEAAAHFECELEETLDVYGNTVVLGRVRHAHVDESLLDDGNVDARAVDAVGRMGGPYYTGVRLLSVRREFDPDL
ncbi:MAG: flavin reductase family protein [Halorientalis sp.]